MSRWVPFCLQLTVLRARFSTATICGTQKEPGSVCSTDFLRSKLLRPSRLLHSTIFSCLCLRLPRAFHPCGVLPSCPSVAKVAFCYSLRFLSTLTDEGKTRFPANLQFLPHPSRLCRVTFPVGESKGVLPFYPRNTLSSSSFRRYSKGCCSPVQFLSRYASMAFTRSTAALSASGST